ncbi:MAG TPA: ribonuclease P protein component [Burkholderiales bacterium]
MRFGRDRRLRRAADFEAVRQRAQHRTRDRFFAIAAVPTSGPARLGVAVSRRVSGNAVVRNRIKRQIRESFRMHQFMLHGLDVVVVAQRPAAEAANATLAASLRAHWSRLAAR